MGRPPCPWDAGGILYVPAQPAEKIPVPAAACPCGRRGIKQGCMANCDAALLFSIPCNSLLVLILFRFIQRNSNRRPLGLYRAE